MKQKDWNLTLNLSPEQYQLLKTKADDKGVSVEGYALFKVLHEEQSSHFAPTEKLLITPAEACELLGIGRTVMYRLIKEGAVPAVKLPNCKRLYLSMKGIQKMIGEYTVSSSEIGGEDDE